MATEIEAKYRLADPEAIEERLIARGGAFGGAVLESNRLYDWPDGRLAGADRALRIRRAEATGGEMTVTVTTKGPRRPGPLKVRDEREFHADDADAVEAVLEALGMGCVMAFEKRRGTWTLDDCTVVVDELPHLGHFLEIEGPDEGAVAALARRLGLDEDALVPNTYVGLISEYCEAHDRDATAFTF
ncbi:MAG: class IV adenylate cyclase [Planctomycetota bacterium]